MVFSTVFFGSIGLGVFYFVLLILAVIEIARKHRKRVKLKKGRVAGLLLAVPILVFFGYCVYYLPNILFSRLPWEAVTGLGIGEHSLRQHGGLFCGAPLFLLCSSDL